MAQYLVGDNRKKKLTPNSMGKTALDILEECAPNTSTTKSEMKRILLRSSNQHQWVKAQLRMTDMTMVVVVLIAAMAFQAAVSPPGGVWQDDTSSHTAGKAVMASTHPEIYNHFVRANTTAFVASLVTIIIITTGATLVDFISVVVVYYAMWVSVAAIGVSYGASLIITDPGPTKPLADVVMIVVFSFLAVVGSLYGLRLMNKHFLSRRRKLHEDRDQSRLSQTL